mmetsp:Transcript_94857/g.268520  ORF Transcript_94857/g.268520 Transcript_94857/m.268520 type:complete len:246 (+) Transcript_94857:319-1056(+)
MPPWSSCSRILYGACHPAFCSSTWTRSIAVAHFRARSTEYMQVKTTVWMRFWRHCASSDPGFWSTSEVRRLMLEGMWPPTQSRPRTSTTRSCSRTSASLSMAPSSCGSTRSKRCPSSFSTSVSPLPLPTLPPFCDDHSAQPLSGVSACCSAWASEAALDMKEAVLPRCELLRESWIEQKDIMSSFSLASCSSASSSSCFELGTGPPPMASTEALRMRFLRVSASSLMRRLPTACVPCFDCQAEQT